MQWIPCSMIECSGFHAAWSNGTLLNEVYFMQHDWMHWIPAAWMNAVDILQHGPKHPDWMQWIPCSVMQCRRLHALSHNGSRLYSAVDAVRPNASRLNAVDFMQHGQKHPDWRQWIPCSMIEYSGLFAPWPKASRLNAVDFMQRHWMQNIPYIVVQWISFVCSGDNAARPNASRLNAVNFMQHGQKYGDWMQWIPCSMIECSVFYAEWRKASR